MKDGFTKRALISASVKDGIEKPARELSEMGYEILATEGTAEYLRKKGIKAFKLSEITGIRETAEIKTLHPEIFRMIFSGEIGLVAVIPYQFDGRRESIDIGGMALLRAAAKAGVVAAYSLEMLSTVVEALRSGKARENAAEVFRFTSEYDEKIAEWLENEAP